MLVESIRARVKGILSAAAAIDATLADAQAAGRAPLSDLAAAELLLGLDRLEEELQDCAELAAEAFGPAAVGG
jgi:hypothetical protein